MINFGFNIPPGTTAEQLALRRKLAMQALAGGSDYSPIQSPWQGLARVAQGALGGYQMRQIEDRERGDRAEGDKVLQEAFAALGGGSSPSSAPSSGASSPNPMGRAVQALAPASPAMGAAGAAGRPAAPETDMQPFRAAISSIESAGFKDPYRAVGPATRTGDRALGRYQVMGENVGPWTEEVLGRRYSKQEFLADDKAQDAVFDAKFGQSLRKFGNPQDAASVWFTGQPASVGANRRASNPDGSPLGIKGSEYVSKFNAALGGGNTPAGGGGGGGEPGGGNRLALAGKLMTSRDPRAQQLGQMIMTAQLSKEKVRPQVVGEGASLVDDDGRVLYQGQRQDEATKARRTAIGKAQGEAETALPDIESGAGETLGIINRLRTHRGLDQGTGWSSLLMSRVPNTSGYAFEQLRKQAQGTAFLTAIGTLRGTGAISNVEGDAATQAVGRMNSAQSKEDFLEALGDYERVVRKGWANAYRKAGYEPPLGILKQGGASPQSGGAPGAAPIADAPEGLAEGTRLRPTGSTETMIVRGGKIVPYFENRPTGSNAAPQAAEASQPASTGLSRAPASAAASVAAGGGGRGVPSFSGKWTEDRRKLEANPSPAAIAAFDQRYGQGRAFRILGTGPQPQGILEWMGENLRRSTR